MPQGVCSIRGVGSFLRHHLPAMLFALGSTLGVGVGSFVLAIRAEAAWDRAFVGSLALLTIWVALAGGLLAASARDVLGSLLRGGAVADSALIALGGIWLLSWRGSQAELLPPAWSILKIYLILVSMVLVGISVPLLARAPALRCALALGGGLVLLVLCATPFWTGGWIENTDDTDAVATWAIRWNPMYSISAAINDPVQFIWHQDAPRMYDKITRLGTDIHAPPPNWYDACWRLGALSAGIFLLGALTGGVRKLRKGKDPAGRPSAVTTPEEP